MGTLLKQPWQLPLLLLSIILEQSGNRSPRLWVVIGRFLFILVVSLLLGSLVVVVIIINSSVWTGSGWKDLTEKELAENEVDEGGLGWESGASPPLLSLLAFSSPYSWLESLFTGYINSSHRSNCSLDLNLRVCVLLKAVVMIIHIILWMKLTPDCWKLMKPGEWCVSLTFVVESQYSPALFKILNSCTVRNYVTYMYWSCKNVVN